MSRIKYHIFVFLVLISTYGFAQDFESDNLLEKNKIDVSIYNAEQEEKRGNLYEAITILKQALKVAENIEDKKDQGIIHTKLANLQYKVDDLDAAVIDVTKAINIQLEIEDRIYLAMSRYTYGLIFFENGKYSDALDHFKSSKTIFEEENRNDLIAEVTLNEAKVFIELNELDKANALLDKTIIDAKKYELPAIQSSALVKSGIVALRQEKFEKALAQTTEGSNIAKENDALEILNESYLVLSDVYAKTGQHDMSSSNLRAYIKLNDSILQLKMENLSPEKRAQYIIDDKNALIQHQKNELDEKNQANSLNKLTTIFKCGTDYNFIITNPLFVQKQ